MYQVRTLPAGKGFGLYNTQIKRWLAPNGTVSACGTGGARVFETSGEAKQYRADKNWPYSKKHADFVADALSKAEKMGEAPEYLLALSKREEVAFDDHLGAVQESDRTQGYEYERYVGPADELHDFLKMEDRPVSDVP